MGVGKSSRIRAGKSHWLLLKQCEVQVGVTIPIYIQRSGNRRERVRVASQFPALLCVTPQNTMLVKLVHDRQYTYHIYIIHKLNVCYILYQFILYDIPVTSMHTMAPRIFHKPELSWVATNPHPWCFWARVVFRVRLGGGQTSCVQD